MRLTAKERNKLPGKDFAGPGRSYPVEDKAHARNAKARASEEERKGKLSKAAERKIDRKADAVMAEKKHEGHKHVDERKEKHEPKGDMKHHGHMPHMGKAVAHLEKDKHKFEHGRSHKER